MEESTTRSASSGALSRENRFPSLSVSSAQIRVSLAVTGRVKNIH